MPSDPAGAPTLRFEYKYPLRATEYERLRDALRPFVTLDPRAESGPRGRYLVRSLYLDTWDFLAYQEKLAGVPNRIKLRLRSYWADADAAKFVNVEIKARYGARVAKFAERVTPGDWLPLLDGHGSPGHRSPVLDEFRRLVLLRAQRPLVLVDYWREAFVPRDGSDTRVTFDHDLRFRKAAELYPAPARGQPAWPRSVVLEIKVRDARPAWLERLVRRFELRSTPTSKYAWGVQQTHPGFVHR